VIAGVLIGGGIYWYCQQPPERRERIRSVAGQIGTHLMGRYQVAAAGVYQARLQLRACMAPRPERRTLASAIVRELALSSASLSAAQLAGLLDPALRPSVAELRAFQRRTATRSSGRCAGAVSCTDLTTRCLVERRLQYPSTAEPAVSPGPVVFAGNYRESSRTEHHIDPRIRYPGLSRTLDPMAPAA
jgi:hypothetical protein